MFFFLNDPATTKISPLPLHDALPIFVSRVLAPPAFLPANREKTQRTKPAPRAIDNPRSEEDTSELQSQSNLVCRRLPAESQRPPVPAASHPIGGRALVIAPNAARQPT